MKVRRSPEDCITPTAAIPLPPAIGPGTLPNEPAAAASVASMPPVAFCTPVSSGPDAGRRIVASASADPFSIRALLAEVGTEPVVAAAFAGKNTTGETLLEHTDTVMQTIEEQLDLRPELAALCARYRPLMRIAATLHDIGKPAAIAVDGHSGRQKEFTKKVLDEVLPRWGLSEADQTFIHQFIHFDISDRSSYGVRARFDADANRKRLSDFVDSVPGVPRDALLAMALVLWFADASAYANVTAASFERDGKTLRAVGDEPVLQLVPLILELAPSLPIASFFAPPRVSSFLRREVCDWRWDCRTATSPWGKILARGAGVEPHGVKDADTRLRGARLFHRIGVDVDGSSSGWPALKDSVQRRLRELDPLAVERSVLVLSSSDPDVMREVAELARAHHCATMLLTDVAVLDPARDAQIPKFDLTCFDNKSDRAQRSLDLEAVIGGGTSSELIR